MQPHAPLLTIALALATLFGCAATPPAQPPIDPAFQTAGYATLFGDEAVIQNERVTLAVSPRVGRIVWFGKTGPGERNLLWIDPRVADAPSDDQRATYINHGGDKVWPMVQPLWTRFLPGGNDWPPDGVIDGQPWELLEHSDTKIVMQSKHSDLLGVRIRREITLLQNPGNTTSRFTPPLQGVQGKPDVRIENVLVRESNSPAPLTLWTVTQIRNPDFIELDIERQNRDDKPWLTMLGTPEGLAPVLSRTTDGKDVRWTHQPGIGGKIGTYGRAIAAHYPDLSFGQRGGFKDQGPYPDGSNVQLYVSDDYSELELLSPSANLEQGDIFGQEVLWYLRD